jgi:hypothetical protein
MSVAARATTTPLRVALLTHSTNPRGGVVHALEVGDALHALGHEATVLAPDPGQRGLFRPTRCASAGVPATQCHGGLPAPVRQRIAEYVAWFERADAPQFDICHAQDSISANALAELVRRGRIPGFVRTVHHLDDFDNPLMRWSTPPGCATRPACRSSYLAASMMTTCLACTVAPMR